MALIIQLCYSSQVIAYLGSASSTYSVNRNSIDKITLYHVLAPIKQMSNTLSEHEEGRWFNVNEVKDNLRQETGREKEHQIWQRFLDWLSIQDKDTLIALLDGVWQG